MAQEIKVDQVLDAKGKSCPGPVIALKKAMKNLEIGQVLEVQATDPGSVPDFKAWADETGHTLLSHTAGNGVFTFYLRKEEV